MVNGIQGKNVYVGFPSPRMFRHAMGAQIMDNSILNYWRHVFIKASLFCENLCHFVLAYWPD